MKGRNISGQRKAMFARWAEIRGKHSTYPIYWRKTKSYVSAVKDQAKWNQFDNPYDRLVLLDVGSRSDIPQTARRNPYGSYIEKKVYHPSAHDLMLQRESDRRYKEAQKKYGK